MQGSFRALLFVGLSGLCTAAWSGPSVYATFTLDVATMKIKDAVQGCTLSPLYPDSSVVIYYDDETSVVNNMVLGNPYDQYGMWAELNSSISKIRSTFTGSMSDRSGTWGMVLSDFESEASAGCGAPVNADGATFRVTSQDTTFSVKPGACSGTATTAFSMEGYGVNTGTGLPVKISRQVKASGTLALGPSAGC